MTPCAVEGCEKAARKRGWCKTHYQRWFRHGSTDPRPRTWDPLKNVDTNGPGGCWIWQGSLSADGYGPHRRIYERLVGPIPSGVQLDHTCRVRHCVNPAHLEPVTPAENLRRSKPYRPGPFRADFCRHGHEYTPENTYWPPGDRRWRGCRACRKRHNEDAYRRRKQQQAVGSSASPDPT